MKKILEVDRVTKYYGGAVVTKALDGISLSVEEGEFVAIMGASGSGKSTLLNVISTIDRVSSGEIRIEGKSVSGRSEDELSAFRRDKLGFVFQEYNLLDTLTVGENILLPLNLRRVPVKEAEERLKKVSEALGVSGELDKFPLELSGGQRQRAACARALITSPALILADEPTGALDSKNSKVLMSTFELMNASLGATILVVTHDAAVGSHAGRALFLKDGKLWNEVIRGKRTRREMYADILSVTAALGGEIDVR